MAVAAETIAPAMPVDSGERDEGEDLLFATMVIVSVGAVIYFNLAKLGVPYTVAMFVFGIVLGLLSLVMADWYDKFFVYFAEIPPKLLFHIFLPVLIFEGSYGVKPFALKTVFRHAAILATLGLVINTVIVAAVVKWLIFTDWDWFAALLLGSILSATDPVAVVTLLKDLGIDANITAVVDAEALMNDGTAIICFALLLPALKQGHMPGSVGSIFVASLRLTVLAFLWGYFIGWVLFRLLKMFEGNPLVTTLQTVCFAYIAYFIADEVFDTSGVLTLFTAGCYLARYYPSMFPGSHSSLLTSTWHFLVHVLNTVIFCLVGIVIARRSFDDFSFAILGMMLFMYVVCVLARAFMITVLLPIMNWGSDWKLGWREVSLQVYGGLRGGVATILALIVADEEDLDPNLRKGFLHITCGIVVMTIVVNATTSAFVVRKLDLQAKPKHRLDQMKFGLRYINGVIQHALQTVKHDVLLRSANWTLVHEIVEGIADPYEEMSCVHEEETQAFTAQVMRVFKTSIFYLRDNGRCTEDVLSTLFMLSQRHITQKTLSSITELNEHVEYPWYILQAEAHFGHVGFMRVQVLDAKKRHDTFFFGLLLAYGEALDRVERIVPDYARLSEHAAMMEAWLERERQEMSHLIQIFQEEKPEAAVAVFTAIAAAEVMKEAEEAVEKLHHDKGFAEFDTAQMEAAVHAAKHPIARLAAHLAPSTASEMFLLSSLGSGLNEMTLNTLASGWVEKRARADQVIDIGNSVGVVVRGIAVVVSAHDDDDALVPGSVWGAETQVIQRRSAPTIVTTTDLEYIVLDQAHIQEWAGDHPIFAANLRLTACRSVAQDMLAEICRFSSLDEDHIETLCRNGKLITVPHDGYTLPPSETDEEVTFYIRGADASGLITDGMAPFVVPRSSEFRWKRGCLLFRLETGYTRRHAPTSAANRTRAATALAMQPSSASSMFFPPVGGGGSNLPMAHDEGSAPMAVEMERVEPPATVLPKVKIDPERCATSVPYFNRSQMLFIAAVEQLNQVATDFTAHPTAHRRNALSRAVDHTIAFLSRFAVSVFQKEEALYRKAGVAGWQSSQQAAHDELQSSISSWINRRAKEEGMLHTDVIETLAAFATTHFPQDAKDVAEAAKTLGAETMAALQTEEDFDRLLPSHGPSASVSVRDRPADLATSPPAAAAA